MALDWHIERQERIWKYVWVEQDDCPVCYSAEE